MADHNLKHTERDETHIPVCQIKVHPGYANSKRIGYDIALLKMCDSVSDKKFISPIKLPPSKFMLSANAEVKTAGWGLTGENGRLASVLQWVAVNKVSSEQCKKSYGFIINERKICAGIFKYGGKDSCQGDSGGLFSL